MQDRFLTYFKRYFPGEQPACLLAVSGGVDSMVLVDLMQKCGFHFGIAHVNFQLRGADSDDDQELVKSLSEKLNVRFHTTHLNAREKAEEPGISLQMAARELRYQWFQSLMKKEGYSFLLTAHHANDQVETVLYNLAKGSGLKGMRGMLPVYQTIFRPLLPFTKAEIMEYAQQQGLNWREDVSNATTKYSRNLLRHKAIPVLKEINPQLEKTVSRMTQRLAALEEILDFAATEWKASVFQPAGKGWFLSSEKLQALPQPNWLLSHWLQEFGFSEADAIDIWEQRAQQTGKKYETEGFQLFKEREGWTLVPKNDEPFYFEVAQIPFELKLPAGSLKFQEIPSDEVVFGKDSSFAYFDLEKLVFPLSIRKWQEGDRFQPLGMKGHKKVSDFLTDKKVPAHLKNTVLVLESNGKVVWVIGYQASEQFKISSATTQVLKAEAVLFYS